MGWAIQLSSVEAAATTPRLLDPVRPAEVTPSASLPGLVQTLVDRVLS
jgi:hypothetical protein